MGRPNIPLFQFSTIPFSPCIAFAAMCASNSSRYFFDKRRRRHRRRVAKRTDRIAHDVAADVENQIEIVLVAFAMLDAVKNLFHPVTAFAAWTALTAGFMGEKARKVPRGPHHAGAYRP